MSTILLQRPLAQPLCYLEEGRLLAAVWPSHPPPPCVAVNGAIGLTEHALGHIMLRLDPGIQECVREVRKEVRADDS